jgi:hypothetical protein
MERSAIRGMRPTEELRLVGRNETHLPVLSLAKACLEPVEGGAHFQTWETQ